MTQTRPVPDRTEAIVPVTRGGALPCTVQQEGLWFEQQLNPGSTAYHIAFALRLAGPLEVSALQVALHALVVRHEALRTRFTGHGGVPRQVVDEPPAGFELPVCDLDPAEVDEWTAAQVDEPMDLAVGPLLRVRLARTGPGRHVLVLVLHHIVGDGWSVRLLGAELSRLYTAAVTGVESDLVPLTIQPADHATWQRQRQDDAQTEEHLRFWRETLAELPTVDLPTDRPRPAQSTGAGGSVRRVLPAELGTAARDYARAHRVSFLAVMHAALLTVLHRWTGQDDLPVGSVSTNRPIRELESLVGYFVNTVVLRTSTRGCPTFAELVGRCHETIMDAANHQDVPFNVVVDAVQPERVAGRAPLFQVGLALQPAGESFADLCPDQLETRASVLATGHAMFDVEIELDETVPGRLQVRAAYSTELFDADRIERLMDHFAAVLQGGLGDPDVPVTGIELMSDAERAAGLQIGNQTAVQYPQTLLHRVFEQVTAERPDAVAVLDHDGVSYSYRQLDTAANRLAHRLRRELTRHPAATVPVIGVCLHRGIDLVTTLMACWKAGAAYLPLDPDLPPERLRHLCHDADPAAVVTRSDLTPALQMPSAGPTLIQLDTDRDDLAREHTTTLPTAPTPDDAAYLLYTSGSTGTPKGVLIPHRGITNRIRWMQDAYPIEPTDAVLQKTPYGFDVSIWEFFWPLTTGARIVLAAPGGHRDPHYLHQLILREKVTTLHFVPTMLNTFLDATTPHYPTPGPLASVRQIFCSGEALPTDTANRVLTTWPQIALHNLYGPTEASIDVTAWTCRHQPGPTPIGTPIANHRAYLLDPHLRPVPLGVPGQLYIAGPGLAHGYLNQPALTATRFTADPFTPQPGQRMYATGDLARRRTNGTIDYLGRTDRQLKLRGQRLEPAEIEHTLTQHPHIAQATVTIHHDTLIAYLVPTPGTSNPTPTTLREHLAQHLPIYMIPTTYITIDQLPLSPNGKLDHTRLPDPTPHTTTHQPPRTPTEHWLTHTCTQLLATTTPISTLDNFFDIGGNSLHATQLIARIHQHFNTHIHLRDLFTHPVLQHLATLIDRQHDRDALPDASPDAAAPHAAHAAHAAHDASCNASCGNECLVTFRSTGTLTPLFLIHPIGGSVSCYTQLAHALGDDRPVHAVEDPALHGHTPPRTLTERAQQYARLVRTTQPDGPYLIAGWSLGGLLAHAVARHLSPDGDQATVIALDSATPPDEPHHPTDLEIGAAFLADLADITDTPLPDIDPETLHHLDRPALEQLALDTLIDAGVAPETLRTELHTRLLAFERNYRDAAAHHPQPGSHTTILITAGDDDGSTDLTPWNTLTPHLHHLTTPGNHYTMLRPPHLATLTTTLARALDTHTARIAAMGHLDT